jgi:hypothetical protein
MSNKPDYVKSNVWKKSSPEAQRYISEFKDFWILFCKVASKTNNLSVIKFRMFLTNEGIDVRPSEWISESVFLELIDLAKQQGAYSD